MGLILDSWSITTQRQRAARWHRRMRIRQLVFAELAIARMSVA